MQDVGGTQQDDRSRLPAGRRDAAARQRRAPRADSAASELILGTNCGGSDGNSGITANPALGVASDMLVAAGGTVILGETTEIYGAEQLLTRRAARPQIAEKLIDRIRGGSGTPACSAARPTTIPRPATRKAG